MIANFAVSADGKVTTRAHAPASFTGEADKTRLRRIRSLGDAVLVGGRTVSADSMSVRVTDPDLVAERLSRGQAPEPLRAIVSASGEIDTRGKLFRGGGPISVFGSPRMRPAARANLAPLCDLWLLPGEEIPATKILEILRSDYRVQTLVCEGGPTLFGSLARAAAIDEIYLTVSPKIFGGSKAPTLTGLHFPFLPEPQLFRIGEISTVANECFLHLFRKKCSA